jgi:hypothetical protein
MPLSCTGCHPALRPAAEYLSANKGKLPDNFFGSVVGDSTPEFRQQPRVGPKGRDVNRTRGRSDLADCFPQSPFQRPAAPQACGNCRVPHPGPPSPFGDARRDSPVGDEPGVSFVPRLHVPRYPTTVRRTAAAPAIVAPATAVAGGVVDPVERVVGCRGRPQVGEEVFERLPPTGAHPHPASAVLRIVSVLRVVAPPPGRRPGVVFLPPPAVELATPPGARWLIAANPRGNFLHVNVSEPQGGPQPRWQRPFPTRMP